MRQLKYIRGKETWDIARDLGIDRSPHPRWRGPEEGDAPSIEICEYPPNRARKERRRQRVGFHTPKKVGSRLAGGGVGTQEGGDAKKAGMGGRPRKGVPGKWRSWRIRQVKIPVYWEQKCRNGKK